MKFFIFVKVLLFFIIFFTKRKTRYTNSV